ncbi:hypothetical protein AMS68_007240 [Peltaster fructicola]|uniref:Acyltransferase 3 domain-containing protein n=1 Tax=Peltaster fructicola TaxID=286661 RepID=A0A6H0Y3Z5_9PEZI|nr:hypothetical protein AMS68_007240 [Peltaster fructicola]
MEPKDSQYDAKRSSNASAPERPLLPLSNRETAAEKNVNSLAFLDGLRGIAALIVYFHHHNTDFYGMDCDIMHPYGYEGRYHIAQWKFIQLFVAGGTAAVMVFFVLSGYVLSRGTFQMLQNGKSTSSIHQYLLNASLRRPIRLWLPPILVSLVVALAFHTPLRPVGAFIDYRRNVFLEVWTWFINLLETVNPFTGHGPFLQAFMYDPPVWTMAYELNGSVVVYALLAICGPYLSIRHRMIALAVSLVISFEYGHFSLVPFMLGMMLAQMDVESLDKPYIDRMSERTRSLFLNGMFVVGWYLLSDLGPIDKKTNPWFGISPSWIPFYFYHNPNFATNIVGAFCMVYAALRLSWLQDLFNRAQWLGRVSFALYLIHIPMIWFLAFRVRRFLGYPIPDNEKPRFYDNLLPIPDVGPMGFTTGLIAMQLICLPLNLALSEVVTRWIDETSVTVSKRFAARVMAKLHL